MTASSFGPISKVERRKVSELVPLATNARTHSPSQVAQIAASIKQWGFTTAILIDEKGMIIAGHGRVLAAQQLGMVHVPVAIAEGWTDAQKRAYAITDNKTADNAGWDHQALKSEVKGLDAAGFDNSLLGFTDDELAALRAGDPASKVREVPTSAVDDVFWITVEGKLELQAEALDRLKQLLTDVPGLKVEHGVLSLDL